VHLTVVLDSNLPNGGELVYRNLLKVEAHVDKYAAGAYYA